MAWIYLAESVDSLSPWRHGYLQSPIVKEIPTAKPSFCLVCMAEISSTHQSGMMCAPCASMKSPVKSTSSMEDSPARTEVLQALVRAWMDTEAAYSLKLSGLRRKQKLHSSSWKTPEERRAMRIACCKRLIRLATTRERGAWKRRRLERTTSESDCGFWPTPTASNYGSNQGGGAGRVGKVRYSIAGLIGGRENPEFREWLMGYPNKWTEIEPWAMRWFRSKRGKRSKD